MSNGWTPERRARQSERIKQWQPWKQSTGPKTDVGKAASSENAFKHGMRCAEWIKDQARFNGVLRDAREYLAYLKGKE